MSKDILYSELAKSARIIIYDLRDPNAWLQAHRDIAVWGKERAHFENLDSDHVIIAFFHGAAAEGPVT